MRLLNPLTLAPITAAEIRMMGGWRYEPPYDVYNLLADPVTETAVAELVSYYLFPFWRCHAVHDATGVLVAFVTFGGDAQVPGGDYDEPALDIGLGMCPALTGQGMGKELVTAVISFARQTFNPPVLRVTVAAFNKRAQRVWQQQGFVWRQEFMDIGEPKRPFVILTCELG